MKCVICDKRPARNGEYCHNCAQKIDADKRSRQKPQPQKYLTYRGFVVGLFPNGNGKLKAQLLRLNPQGLPKTKTLDLNRYCEGYTRDIIKSFKRCILQLANA